MLRIALCEDEQHQLDWLQTAVTTWGEKRKKAIHLDVFKTAKDLLRSYQTAGQYDVALLDINMESGISGMEAAQAIRELDEGAFIIFITANKDYLVKGYEVEAFRYLLKPIQQDGLFSALDGVVAKLEAKEHEIVLLPSLDGYAKMALPDLLFIESRGHLMEIHWENGVMEMRETLSSMEQTLGTRGFIRSHRCYLVNLRRIFRLKEDHCLLDNGQRVPVSRKQYPVVKKAFMDWVANER